MHEFSNANKLRRGKIISFLAYYREREDFFNEKVPFSPETQSIFESLCEKEFHPAPENQPGVAYDYMSNPEKIAAVKDF